MGPSLRQSAFNLMVTDKYLQPKTFKIEVINIFLTKYYDINDAEKDLMTRPEQESCEHIKRLFHILSEKVTP